MLLNYQTLRRKQDQIVKEVDQKKITDAEQREAARQFVNKWWGKGNEDEDGRPYWLDFLSNVIGMENATDRVKFGKKVVGDCHE